MELFNFDKFDLSGITINYADSSVIKEYFKDILSSEHVISYQIITFNLDFLRISRERKEFFEICKNAHIVLPDGAGITSLVNLKYRVKIKRITGNDLFEIILQISNDIPIKLALVGSSEKVLSAVQKKLSERYPNAKVVAAISPKLFFEEDPEENRKIINQLKESRPEILLLALGCPRQEKWINSNKDEIGAKINIGVGAVFDFYSGIKKRSPEIFQNNGLEWFWRLLHEPKRLYKRYLKHDMPLYFRLLSKLLFEKLHG